jgi:hypothetical protein
MLVLLIVGTGDVDLAGGGDPDVEGTMGSASSGCAAGESAGDGRPVGDAQ